MQGTVARQQLGPRQQAGLSLGGFIMFIVIAALIAIPTIKALPAYMEFFSVKKAMQNVANEQAGADKNEITGAFARRADIENIKSVSVQDLQIVSGGGKTTISVNYEKKVDLVGNMALLMTFQHSATSGGK